MFRVFLFLIICRFQTILNHDVYFCNFRIYFGFYLYKSCAECYVKLFEDTRFSPCLSYLSVYFLSAGDWENCNILLDK